MKNLILALTMILTGAATASESLISDVTTVHLDNEVHFYQQGLHSGRIKVDVEEETIQLALRKAFYCPPDRFCAQVMPAPVIVELPLVDIAVDDCGSVVFTAELDKTPVDGLKQILIVRDNTENQCPTLVPLSPVEVEYMTENLRLQKETHSHFEKQEKKASRNSELFSFLNN